MNFAQEIKRANDISKVRHLCKCGHSVIIPAKLDFIYCSHCNRIVYKNEKAKFKHKLSIKLRGKNNEQVSQ